MMHNRVFLLMMLFAMIVSDAVTAQFPFHPDPKIEWQVKKMKKNRVKQMRIYDISRKNDTSFSDLNFDKNGLVHSIKHYTVKSNNLLPGYTDTFVYRKDQLICHQLINDPDIKDSTYYSYVGSLWRKESNTSRNTYSDKTATVLWETVESKWLIDSNAYPLKYDYFVFYYRRYVFDKQANLLKVLDYYNPKSAPTAETIYYRDKAGNITSVVERDETGAQNWKHEYFYNKNGLLQRYKTWYRSILNNQVHEEAYWITYSFYQ